MISRSPFAKLFCLFAVLICCSLLLESVARGQDAAATEQPAATEGDATEGEDEAEPVDPFEVPDGTPEELVNYIRTGPSNMRPRSREQLVQMFVSLEGAADKILAAEGAEAEQRKIAVETKLESLTMQTRIGAGGANERFEEFVASAMENETPEIQAVVKQYHIEQQVRQWNSLSQDDRNSVVAEIKEQLSGDEVDSKSLVLLMKFADSVAETPDAPVAIELIGQVLPKFESSEDENMARRVQTLEGIANRLQLPGNEMTLDGTLLDGEELDWSQYRGKVVLVDYWATWCGPCIAELPNVLEQYEAYHDKGFEVLGISLDDNKAKVEQFMADQDLPWTTLYSDDPAANG